jgi:hypothetical protein
MPAPTPPPAKRQPKSLASIGRRAKLLGWIAVAVLLLGAGGVAAFLIHASSSRKAVTVGSANDYDITSVPLGTLSKNSVLSLDQASELSINGQLRINNSFVLTPTDTPANPLLGQFYLNNTNNLLYYYNGTQFENLATGSEFNSLGPVSKTSAGGGLTINGSQLINTGVTSLIGTSNQITVSGASGNITVSLPQDIATGSAPTFSAIQVGSLTARPGDSGLVVGNGIQDLSLQGATTTLSSSNGGFTTSLAFATPTANTTITVPDIGGTICTTSGNCGSGGAAVELQPTSPGIAQTGNINISGTVVAGAFSGDGSNLIDLNAANITTGALAVSNGGTGAINPANARTNLGAAASGVNSDITSLTDLSSITPSGSLAIGAAAEPLTLQGSAATTFTAADSGFTTTLEFAQPTADASIILPNSSGTVAVQASGPLELDSNGNLSCPNCLVSTGGGGGTVGVVSVNSFTGAITIAQGTGLSLTNNSGTITIGADQNIATSASPTFGGLTLNGALGVGVSVPQYAVDVNGDVNVSGAFRVNGVTICTSSGCTAGGGSGNYIQNGTSIQTANLAIQGASGTNTVALVRGATGQTANIFAVQTSTGTNLLSVTPSGQVGVATASPNYPLDVNGDINTNGSLRVNGTAVCSSTSGCTPVAGSNNYIQNGTSLQVANFAVQSAGASSIGGVIRGASGQTADLLQVQANNGTVLFSSSANGNGYVAGDLGVGNLSPAYALDVSGDANITGDYRINGTAICTSSGCTANGGSGSYVQNGTTLQAANFAIQSQSAASVGGLIRGASGQTADLFDVQNALGTDLLSVTPAGTANVATSLVVGNVSSPTYTLEVGGDANITGDYRINGVAVCSASGCSASGGSGNYIQNSTTLQAANFSIQSAAATNSPTAVIEQASSQTGDLLDLDASGGSIVAAINPSGQLRVGGATAYTSALNIGTNTTTALGGITLGTDTDLYRGGSGILKTDGTFQAGELQESGADFTTGLVLQSTTPSSTRSTNLTFTDDQSTPQSISLRKEGNNLVVLDNSGNVQLGFSPASAGILFGTSLDTDLYRSGTDALTTDGSLTVAQALTGTGTTLFKNSTNSTTAFQITNAAGTNLFAADTADQRIGIDTTVPPSYPLDVNGDINTSGVYRINGTILCNSAGCAPSSGSTSYIQNGTSVQSANFAIQSANAGYVGALIEGATSQTANLLQVQNSTGTVLDQINAAGALSVQSSTTSGALNIGTNASTTASGGIYFGTDTDLYRSAANTLTTNGSLTVGGTGSTNSATEFQVQNASGTAALSVNTSTLTTTVQAGTDTTILSSNLATCTDFTNVTSPCTGSQWTTSGWSPIPGTSPSTSISHNSGNSSALSTNQVTPVNGTEYEVTYTISGTQTFGSTLAVSFGGTTINYTINTADAPSMTESRVITAANGNILTFSPNSAFTSTISNVAIQQVTQTPVAALVVDNASGAPDIQITASSNTTNSFIGLDSGSLNSSGTGDTAMGTFALQDNTTGINNTALGYQALEANSTGSQNVAVGENALAANSIGIDNVAVGYNALHVDTTGYGNDAIGFQALNSLTTGGGNVAIGQQAADTVTSGTDNIALGWQSLEDLNTGAYNIGLGYQALNNETSAQNDVAIGYSALAGDSTGATNIAIGDQAGYTNVSADKTTSGSNNIFLGANSGQGQFAYQSSNSAAIGLDATVNQSNAVILGCTTNTATTNSCPAATTVGIGSQYAPNPLTVSPSVYGTNGTAGTTTTITQSTTTVTGSSSPATAFTSGMVGGTLYYNDGSTATINSVNVGAQTMVVSASKTISSAASYTIVYGGFNVNPAGTTYLQPTTDSTTAFKIQNAANTTTLFDADTTDGTIGIGQVANSSYTLGVTGTINATSNIYVNGVAVCTVNTCAAGNSSSSFINNGTTLQAAANFNIQSAAAGSVGGVIEGAGSQTADLLDLKNSSGTVLSGFTSAGALQGGNGSGTNNGTTSPQNLTLNGGQGTGTGAGGNILFQVAKASGTSGSTLNSLTTVGTISGTNGSVLLQNSVNSLNAFEVESTSGSFALDVDTTDTRVGISTVVPSQALTINGGNENFRLQTPTSVSAIPSASGGSLATGTYYYKVTAIDGAGNETNIASSTEVSAAVTGPSGSVTISWTGITGALNGYRVYRGTTPGGENTYFSVAYGTNSYIDTGTAGTAGSGVSTNNASVVYINGSGGTANSYFNDGNVGIGTSSPTSTLSVAGSFNVTGSSGTISVDPTGAILGLSRAGYNYINATSSSGTLVLGAGGNQNLLQIASGGAISTNGSNVSINTLAGPTATLTSGSSGGSLGAATYLYKIVTNGSPTGNSIAAATTPSSVTTSGSASVNTISWSYVPGNNGYTVYRSTNGGSTWSSNTVTPGATTMIDNGTNFTWSNSVTPPTTATAAGTFSDLGASALFQNSSNSTTAFQIQNAGGSNTLLDADTSNLAVGINGASTTAGFALNVAGTINASTGIDIAGTPIASSNLSDSSNLAKLNGTQSFTGNNTFTGSGNNSTVAGSGTLFENATNSTNALEIQNAAGTSNLFVADTTDSKIGIGVAPTSTGSTLQVTGTITATSTIYSNLGFQINTASNSSGALVKGATAGTGGISNNDVVVMNSSDQVVDTTTARDPRVYGVSTGTYAASAFATIAVNGNATVNATAVSKAIAVGDQLVTSTTSGDVMSDNSATTGIVGTALTALASGTGTVDVELGVVHGQSTETFSPQSDSTTAFQIQNAGRSTTLFDADTTDGLVGVGAAPTAGGSTLQVAGTITSTGTITVGTNTFLSGTTLEIGGVAVCTSTGCGASSGSGNYIQNGTGAQVGANFNIQSASAGSVGAVIEGATSQTADLLDLENGSAVKVLTVGSTGNTLIEPSTNSATAFQVQNSTAFPLFAVDTSGDNVNLGVQNTSDANTNLQVYGTALVRPNVDGTAFQVQNSGGTITALGVNTSTDTVTVGAASIFNSSATMNSTLLLQNTNTSELNVTNTSGTSAFKVNTTALQTIVNQNTTVATLGSTLFNGKSFASPTTGWTAISGTGTSATATHSAGGGTTALANNGSITLTNGTAYQVNFSVSGETNAGESVTPQLGGSFGSSGGVAVYGNDASVTQIIYAAAGSTITFTPTNNWNGTITNVTIDKITQITAPFTVNGTGTGDNVEIRASGSSNFYSLSVGYDAGQNNSTGTGDTAVGTFALQSATTGAGATALGYQALNLDSSGSNNTAIGSNALAYTTDGGNNVALGDLAGVTSNSANANETGSNNTFIGYEAGPGTTTPLQNASSIGTYSVVDESNALVLGCLNGVNGCTANTEVGIDNATPAYALDVVGDINTSSTIKVNGTTVCSSTGCTASSTSAILNGTSTQTGNFNIQSAATGSVGGVIEGASGQTADLLDLENGSGAKVVTVGATGNTLVQPSTNSTTAFQIQNAAGSTTLLAANTSTTQISVTGQLAVTGGISTVGLTVPSAPTVANIGTSGSTHYTYAVSALNANGGSTLDSATTQTTGGNATLSGTNYNQITWTGVTGASSYNIYRTASSGTPSTTGLIGNVSATSTLSFNDTGIAGGAAVPTVDNSGQLDATGTVLLKNAVNSTTAFQIQNASGTSLLTANTSASTITTNGELIASGATSVSTGSEMMTSSESFPATNGWTGISGTGTSATATHTTVGGYTTALSPTPALTITSGKYYQVSFTITGNPTAGQSVTPGIGGTTGQPIYGNDAGEVQILLATGTGNLSFTPTSSWNGTISTVSVKLVTPATASFSAAGSPVNGNSNLNLYFGTQAGILSLGAGGNVGIGPFATASVTNGVFNTAVGYSALGIATTGSNNTALGGFALSNNTTGGNNTALGYQAGYGSAGTDANITGSGDTFIGYNSGPGTTTQLQNATAIGIASAVSESNALVLGCVNGNVNGCTANTEVGIDNATPSYALDVVGDINASSTIKVNGTTVCSSTGCTASSTSAILNGTSTQTGNFNIQSAATGNVGGVIEGASGQTADLLDLENGSGVIVHSVSATGNTLVKPSTNSTTAFQVQNAGGSTTVLDADTTNGRVGIGTAAPGNLLSVGALTTASSTSQLAVSTGGTTNSGIVIQDVASQSGGYLLQAQNSSGTNLASIDYQGNLVVQSATVNGTLTLNGHLITGNSSGTTTATKQSALGTTGSCSVTGDDTTGTITMSSGGSGETNGDFCEINFGSAYGVAPNVVVGGGNGNGADMDPYADNVTTGHFYVGSVNNSSGFSGSIILTYIVAQ